MRATCPAHLILLVLIKTLSRIEKVSTNETMFFSKHVQKSAYAISALEHLDDDDYDCDNVALLPRCKALTVMGRSSTGIAGWNPFSVCVLYLLYSLLCSVLTDAVQVVLSDA
jgi:hypothetical protein